MESILSTSPWEEDFEVLDMPWRDEKIRQISQRSTSRCGSNKDGKLVFGIMKSDGNVRPHPPVQRAVNLVADALEASGHEVSTPCQ